MALKYIGMSQTVQRDRQTRARISGRRVEINQHPVCLCIFTPMKKLPHHNSATVSRKCVDKLPKKWHAFRQILNGFSKETKSFQMWRWPNAWWRQRAALSQWLRAVAYHRLFTAFPRLTVTS